MEKSTCLILIALPPGTFHSSWSGWVHCSHLCLTHSWLVFIRTFTNISHNWDDKNHIKKPYSKSTYYFPNVYSAEHGSENWSESKYAQSPMSSRWLVAAWSDQAPSLIVAWNNLNHGFEGRFSRFRIQCICIYIYTNYIIYIHKLYIYTYVFIYIYIYTHTCIHIICVRWFHLHCWSIWL